ncbi:MAG: N-acetylglucosamine-6-phosphate deacetylase [Oscillospiraceae bacterium]|nr:N-acetylglucosamine-6-phosphate deacetylase [Oscillospiraceae bacterium]
MRIVNAKVFLDGAFLDGGIEFADKITAVGSGVTGEGIDAGGCYVIPGLIDIHTHAAKGEDASDGRPEGMPVMSRYYAAGGVTSWCPTTMTLKEPVLTQAMHTIRDFVRPTDGAKVAGVNLEGPFLSRAKRGAQNADNLHAPDAEMFKRLNDASGGIVRLVTIAPEEPGSIPFIREVSRMATVSIGHTTADYDTAMAAYDAGASHATHLYNGMPSLLHRAPGVIAAASDAGATVELITDGLHIHPAVIRLTHRLFGDKLVLISDSLRCAGMPDGAYTLGGQPITMKDGKATLTGTDTLAGSSIHLMDGLRRAVSFGVPLEAAITAATQAPARVIRRENQIGSLAVGYCADLVVLDRALNLKAVYIDGRQVK